MSRRSSRSFTPYDAAGMLLDVVNFRKQVIRWLARIPIDSSAYLALSILNSVLLITGDLLRGDDDALHRGNGEGGPPPSWNIPP